MLDIFYATFFLFLPSFKFCFIKTNSLKVEAKIDQKDKEVSSAGEGMSPGELTPL